MTAWPGDRLLVVAGVGVGLLLTVATLVAAGLHRRWASPETARTCLRIRTWWVIVGCLLASMAGGVIGLASLFCLVSFLALGEFVTLDRQMRNPNLIRVILAGGTIALYLLMVFLPANPYVLFAGVGVMLLVGCGVAGVSRSVSRGVVAGAAFLLAVGGLICVVLLGCGGGNTVTAAGLRGVFFLLLLTGLNDVAQYLWGKGFGVTPIVPRLSPRKTLVGLVGGVATTSVLASILAPYFMAQGAGWGIVAGFLIGFGGFIGDILASAYKRSVDAGESGTLLPGHGGIIDRIDSLCVTAPVLYCAVYLG